VTTGIMLAYLLGMFVNWRVLAVLGKPLGCQIVGISSVERVALTVIWPTKLFITPEYLNKFEKCIFRIECMLADKIHHILICFLIGKIKKYYGRRYIITV
jgi:hypothetical protein